jgi:MFS-type transporter involved in bile tolerance (Atg22 family)
MWRKLKSIKTLCLIWIITIITLIVFTNRNEWLPLVNVLAWAPLAYFGANVVQDKIFSDKDKLNK